ncbi:Hypothetical predicted protein [Pelobates cultripes]|uniref:Endonuclease/exonuclease/phosphatase domain-containing protein n=1 Tax=Pelobates cultripes TaxID=61616 RepID=A0AAD1W973_PELCU|nr:Hypothetical predicted protein [Pelobates cultripes]
MADRMAQIEADHDTLTAAQAAQTSSHSRQKTQMQAMARHIEDLDNRCCRQNLRIRGLQEDVLRDNHRRYICVKGTIANRTYTFANIYAPNKHQHHFLRTALKAVERFTEGCLVIGGDLNVALTPTMDTSMGSSMTPQHILTNIAKTLNERQKKLQNTYKEIFHSQDYRLK